LFIGIDGNCGNYLKYNGATWEQFVNPPEIGETDLPMSPGLVIPSGDSLCAGTDGIDVDITVSGYTVARSAVPWRPVGRERRSARLPRPRQVGPLLNNAGQHY
jgi:hypothetical protein